ncbi:MAG TPA: hydantoinase/oxoprolinase family protein [Clostridia bacterium]|nr:hydantoinase/oxoprolinase family protein [Clostridia bacterium]
MLIGIDIGGTYTDGVLCDQQQVIKSIKVPTQKIISHSIENALTQLIKDWEPSKIKQITLSTTLITNLIMEEKLAKTGMLLFPGPGADPQQLKFACPLQILKGAIDYRGRVIESIDWSAVEKAVEYFLKQAITHLVVAGKFSQRNPNLELKVVEFIREKYSELKVIPSHQVSGLLNWVRRSNGAYYTLTTQEANYQFREKIIKTLQKLNLNCPVNILKADGGTLPLDTSLKFPLETIFSGPAASTLGALACTGENTTAVVIDMGGTTTDLALLLAGKPLLSSQGAFIKKYPLPVRSLAMASLALGGDTPLEIKNGKLSFGFRQGQALCLGGPKLTISDILVYSGYSKLGTPESVVVAIEKISGELNLTSKEFAQLVLNKVIKKIELKLAEMFKSWEEEPAYRIWQVLSPQKERPRILICLGGPASGIGKYWQEKEAWQIIVPPLAEVANALGAALAKTTLIMDLFIDTEQKIYTTNLGGLQGDLTHKLRNIDEAKKFARELFQQAAQDWHLDPTESLEILYAEGFNIVRGWETRGRIFQIGLQTVPGIKTFLKGAERNA